MFKISYLGPADQVNLLGLELREQHQRSHLRGTDPEISMFKYLILYIRPPCLKISRNLPFFQVKIRKMRNRWTLGTVICNQGMAIWNWGTDLKSGSGLRLFANFFVLSMSWMWGTVIWNRGTVIFNGGILLFLKHAIISKTRSQFQKTTFLDFKWPGKFQKRIPRLC